MAKKRAKKTKPEFSPLSRKARKHERFGPEGDAKYMVQMEAFVQDTIQTLKRNGVKTFNTEE